MTEQATTRAELVGITYLEQEKQFLGQDRHALTRLWHNGFTQRNRLLKRIQQQQDIDNGRLPDFISETASNSVVC